MQRIKKNFKYLFRDEKGATAIEYGLIVALVAVGAIIAISLLGTNNKNLHENTAQKVHEVVESAQEQMQ